MGNTEGTRRGGVPLLRGWPPPGGGRLGPGSAQGTRCTLLCPSSALFPSFLLERCFICPPHSRAHVPGAVWGGLEPRYLRDAPSCCPPPGSGDHPLPTSVGFSWGPPHGEHLPGGPVPSPAPRGARAAGEGGQNRDGEGWGCRSSAGGVKGETRPGARGRVGQEEICLGVLPQQLLAFWGRGVGPPKVPRLLRTHPGGAVTPCPGSAGS